VATSCVEPRAQAIALSSLFAAGALLLSVSAIIGAIASLALLLALTGLLLLAMQSRVGSRGQRIIA
ncbi:hypothetical protein ACV347_32290, partial [Pseudomonas aeruginosa]